MESTTRPADSSRGCVTLLESRFIPDARFAKAYAALGDQRRALLKGLIADHFALAPPAACLRSQCERLLAGGLAINRRAAPRPLVLLLADETLDAPALLLAALMPALTSGAAEVLVLRLGARAALPDSLLTACELAGQERVAAVNAAQAEALLAECAASGSPGLVLHPDSPGLRRVLARPGLRARLDASALRLVPLRLPTALGLWRDAPTQFDPERVALLYGALALESGGAAPVPRPGAAPETEAFRAFAAHRRDLLLVPDDRLAEVLPLAAGPSGPALVVAESRLGLWTWPELSPELFEVATLAYAAAPEPQAQGRPST